MLTFHLKKPHSAWQNSVKIRAAVPGTIRQHYVCRSVGYYTFTYFTWIGSTPFAPFNFILLETFHYILDLLHNAQTPLETYR